LSEGGERVLESGGDGAGRAGSEPHRVGFDVEQRRELFAGEFDGGGGPPAEAVFARVGVAVTVEQRVINHGGYARVGGYGGVIVEVDRFGTQWRQVSWAAEFIYH